MLTFNVKKEWFEKFSVIELRFGTPKIFDQEHDICFMNGMFSEEKRPRLYAKLKSLSLKYGLDTDLKINKPVYDIEFELIKEQEDAR